MARVLLRGDPGHFCAICAVSTDISPRGQLDSALQRHGAVFSFILFFKGGTGVLESENLPLYLYMIKEN